MKMPSIIYKFSIISCINILLFIGLNFFSCQLWAVTKTSTGTGNWSNAATWSPAGVPAVGDDVIIGDNDVVTLDGNYSCLSLTIGSSVGNPATLTISGSNTLTVTGNVILLAASGGGIDKILNINAGTLTIGGNLRVGDGNQGGTNANRQSIVNITTGTLTISGSLTLEPETGGGDNAQAVINVTSTGTLNLAGSFTLPNSGLGT